MDDQLESHASFPGLEDHDEELVAPETAEGSRRRLASQEVDHDQADAIAEGGNTDEFETLGDFVQAGAKGARRQLLNWKVGEHGRALLSQDHRPNNTQGTYSELWASQRTCQEAGVEFHL